jgi:hypothetical protein
MINFSSKSPKKAIFSSILAIFSIILGISAFSSCSKSGASEQEQMISFAKSICLNSAKKI